MSLVKKISTHLPLVLVIAGVALVGTLLLVSSHALTPYSNPYSCPSHPLLQFGSSGSCVQYVQYTLHVSADGSYGDITKTAVQHFQYDNRIANSNCTTSYTTCDGVVGSYTWPKIDSYNASQTQAAQPTNNSAPTGSVSYTLCNGSFSGSESDADRPNDGARVLIVAGGATYTVTSTTRAWTWTIPAAIKNKTTYAVTVYGRNVDSTGSFSGADTGLAGSPVYYDYGLCAPAAAPAPSPPPAASPPTTGTTPVSTPPSAKPGTLSVAGAAINQASNNTTGPDLGVSTQPASASLDTSPGTAQPADTVTATDGTTPTRSSTPSPKAPKSKPVKAVVIGGLALLAVLGVGGAALYWSRRRRLEPSYDANVISQPVAPSQAFEPPAGPPNSPAAHATPPPSPYAPPVADNIIAQKINEAFYPNQTMAASIAAAKRADQPVRDEVPDMYEIANQHPESFGNAQHVRSESPQPPRPGR